MSYKKVQSDNKKDFPTFFYAMNYTKRYRLEAKTIK